MSLPMQTTSRLPSRTDGCDRAWSVLWLSWLIVDFQVSDEALAWRQGSRRRGYRVGHLDSRFR